MQTINKAKIEPVCKVLKSVEALDFEGMGKFLDDNYEDMGPSFGNTIRKKKR